MVALTNVHRAGWWLAVLMAGVVTASVHALYMRVDVDNVPVTRLVTNLERLLRDRPTDPDLHLNLARAHAMAWAQKTEEIDIARNREEWGPWFGYSPKAVPFTVSPTKDPAKLKAAAPHLAQALSHYADAIKLAPNDLVARLGQAWLIDRSGEPAKAIPLYRDVIARAWAVESRELPLGTPIVEEAAAYLMPLLDPVKDRDELATLRDRLDRLSRMMRPITPIAIPLRDGLDLDQVIDPTASVAFDADGSGLAKRWTWITPDAGWLVYNQRERLSVDSALQLFGHVTFWLFWNNGYDALGALDDDGDGELRGAELAHMGIWRDRNRNGISEPGELRPLAEWGIASLSCRYDIREDDLAAAWSPRGVTLTSGHTRPTWDVWLQRR